MDGTTNIGVLGRRTLLGSGAAGLVLAKGRARAQATVPLTMSVWGAAAEEDAFKAAIGRYMALHPEVAVKLEVSGNAPALYQQVDTRLAGRQAPDIFRVQYQQIGRYASARAIVDLAKYLPPGFAEGFGPAFWQAVTYKGQPYAIPHHTDTFALYYNADIMQALGVTPPTSPGPELVVAGVHPGCPRREGQGRRPLRLRHGLAERRLPLAAVPVPARRRDAERRPDPVAPVRSARVSRRSPGRSPGSPTGWSHPPPPSRARSSRRTCSPTARSGCTWAATGRSRSWPRT